jgi:hypothetical protein
VDKVVRYESITLLGMHRLACAAVLLCATANPTTHAQWTIQDSQTTADLRGIHSIGNGIAWASGTEGTILRTTNDGKDWQRCATPPDADHLDFRGIQVFDSDTAIVMSSGKGPLSRLYKTTDACHTWKLVFTNPDKDGFWDAIKFNSRRTGMVIGDPVKGLFPIFSSTDAGMCWSRADHLPTYAATTKGTRQSTESIFAASNSTLLIYIDPRPHTLVQILFATGGDGSSVHYIQNFDRPIPLLGGGIMGSSTSSHLAAGQTAGAFSLAAAPGPAPVLLVAVGGDYQRPELANSIASSCLWKEDGLSSVYRCEPALTQPHGYRSSVAYDQTMKSWITVGPNGTDISTDDGRNWRALRPGPNDPPDADQHWNALSLPFVVGPHGHIGKLRPEALGR